MPESPMFPLGAVLLPGGVLPLQVFEPRYLEMFRELLERSDDPPEFGEVLITRGREAGGGDERAMIGTRARVVDMHATPDGRYVLAAYGVERIRVLDWLPDDPYPRAVIEPWPDESVDAAHPDHAPRVSAMFDRVIELHAIAESLGQPAVTAPELSDDVSFAVYQLGAFAPIGPADRYRLLEATSISERLDALESSLEDAAAVLEFRRS